MNIHQDGKFNQVSISESHSLSLIWYHYFIHYYRDEFDLLAMATTFENVEQLYILRF